MTTFDYVMILAVIALFASFTGKGIKKLENEVEEEEYTPVVPIDDFPE